MDAFHDLVSGSRGFFAQLAANNDREWYAAHKAEYEAAVKRPAELLLEEVAARLSHDLAQPTKPKLYRVYRDVRFSKDKTPYNTHLHMEWSAPDAPVCYLFGAAADYCKLGVGAMAFPKETIAKWRERVDAGADVVGEAAKLESAGWQMSEPELKRVPSPYDADNPRAVHLKRKGLILWHDLSKDETKELTTTLPARFSEADGFRRALVSALA
jgi:uncharacterized protein (TIGR02453 family)